MQRLLQFLVVSCTLFGVTGYSEPIRPKAEPKLIKVQLVQSQAETSGEDVPVRHQQEKSELTKAGYDAIPLGVFRHFIGLSHFHCDFGDGKFSVKHAADYCRREKLSFIFLTPHANSVDKLVKEVNGKFHYQGEVGYQNFVNQCYQNSDTKLTIIPGTEFGDAKDGNSHFLVLGIYDASVFYQALKIYNDSGQKETLAYFNRLNLEASSGGRYYPIIAAHPDFSYRHFDVGKKLLSETSYRFNFGETEPVTAQPNGLELLNNGNTNSDNLETNLRHVLEKCFNGKGPTFFTGGCDYHSGLAEGGDVLNNIGMIHQRPFADALNRRTVIWAYSNSADELINGLRISDSAALYRNLSYPKIKDLPNYILRPPHSMGNSADILSHPPVKIRRFPFQKFFTVNSKLRVEYCWYKIRRSDSGHNDGSTVLIRTPKSGYYDNYSNGFTINDQPAIIISDSLEYDYEQYILFVKTALYTVIYSPQPEGHF